MKKLILLFAILSIYRAANAQQMTAEDYYVAAFNEMSDMLAGRDSLSIKRAVYLAEWAYYEGKLDYQKDFCDEIDRIVEFVNLFYTANKLNEYKTGKQMALNEYFFRPYSGNGYKPYTYDFDNFTTDETNWERQFVSKVLKTHIGQCRSLPWMYKILAKEIGADVSLAHCPAHCFIIYKDEDNLTPEEWINLELTTHQMQPAFWIRQEFELNDSAISAGTYMTPLTDKETVACQMAELAFGYNVKFNRYDEFTYYCTSRSLEFYSMNPNAWIIRGKSLNLIIQNYQALYGRIIDDYLRLTELMSETKLGLNKTHMVELSSEFTERRKAQVLEGQRRTKAPANNK